MIILSNIKKTIGNHNVRNLILINNIAFGEVSHEFDEEEWEFTVWNRCNLNNNYFISTIGEWWDIEII